MGILDAKQNAVLEAFADRAFELLGVDPDWLSALCAARVRELNGAPLESEVARMEERWYETQDFGVYNEDAYLAEVWACWSVYSRPLVRFVRKTLAAELAPWPRSIIDLGCGPGLSTTALAQLNVGPVIGTNVPESPQFRIAQDAGSRHGFGMSPELVPADAVVACEYFEHFERPVEHLDAVLAVVRPRSLIIQSSYGARAIGHFDAYTVNDRQLRGAQVSKAFNARLREAGYERLPLKVWNGRPQWWVSLGT